MYISKKNKMECRGMKTALLLNSNPFAPNVKLMLKAAAKHSGE
jgi:hypothetical protein